MIYTGLRRAEIVTLRWDDIDFENQTVTVRHGKGDKRRIAAIADVTEATKRALLALWGAQAGAYDCLFPTMTAGRNPRFEADTPMSAQTIVRLLSRSSKRAAIGHLSAHDLRRTHITLALDNGAPLAGHASASRSCQPLDHAALCPTLRCQVPPPTDCFLNGWPGHNSRVGANIIRGRSPSRVCPPIA